MGLFLQTAIIPNGEAREVRKAAENVAEYVELLDPAQCGYRESEQGVTVLFNESCCGYEELAKELSEELTSPVLLLYIYDEDFWGYYFYEGERNWIGFLPCRTILRSTPQRRGSAVPGTVPCLPIIFKWLQEILNVISGFGQRI